MAKKAQKIDRSAKLDELRQAIETLEDRISELTQAGEQRALIESVAEGLYEETDKLCKKAPAEQVTELLLEQVNQVIKETKELIEEDPYVRRMNQFVAAGDRPEHRDVVLVLRMVLQALKRFDSYLDDERPEAARRLREARVLEYATQQWQDEGVVVTKRGLNPKFIEDADGWFVDEDLHFDFSDLDEISVAEYFDLE